MKRSFCIIMVVLLCALMVCPMTAYATKFTLTETDATININDAEWYVFTRDNIKDNPELDELGTTYEEVYRVLYGNNAYLYALAFYDTGEYIELFVRTNKITSGMVNLSNYTDEQVLEVAKGVAEKQSATNYSVYKTDYKYGKLNYKDAATGYHLYEFITVINGVGYTFTFQSQNPFDATAYQEFESIIKSISFDINPNMKETAKTSDSESIWDNVLTKTIAGAVVGGGAAAAVAIINKMKKKSQSDAPSTFNNTDEL